MGRLVSVVAVALVACGEDVGRPADWEVVTFERRVWHGYCSMSAPLVDGVVVYFAGGYAWDDRTAAYAVDAVSGNILWRTPLGSIVSGADVVIEGDRFYVAIADTLRALDRSDGRVLWSYPEVGYERVAGEGTVYTSRYGPWIAALDGDDGSELWRRELPEPVAHALVLLGERVYALSAGRLFGIDRATGDVAEPLPEIGAVARLAALDSTLMFTAPSPAGGRWTIEYSPATGGADTMAMELVTVQDDLIVLSRGKEVLALDRFTRAILWTSETIPTAAAGGGLYHDGVLYQPDPTGDVRAFRALDVTDGSERWRFRAGDLLRLPATDGRMLFVTSDDCRLYAFRIP